MFISLRFHQALCSFPLCVRGGRDRYRGSYVSLNHLSDSCGQCELRFSQVVYRDRIYRPLLSSLALSLPLFFSFASRSRAIKVFAVGPCNLLSPISRYCAKSTDIVWLTQRKSVFICSVVTLSFRILIFLPTAGRRSERTDSSKLSRPVYLILSYIDGV